ncbi:hypothetical protein AS149_26015 [Burkholderia cenocepacia]|nr:hypothetical protein AS149_26015 [Burkholderia cenocepacia]
MEAELNENLPKPIREHMQKRLKVAIIAALCALGIGALAMWRWFPQWHDTVAFTVFAIAGGWGGLASLAHRGARKLSRQLRLLLSRRT